MGSASSILIELESPFDSQFRRFHGFERRQMTADARAILSPLDRARRSGREDYRAVCNGPPCQLKQS
jgi:hypothetical protein